MRLRLLTTLATVILSAAGSHAASGAIELNGRKPDDTAFEICVNGQVIRSSDPSIWEIADTKEYLGPNGSTMTTLRLDGKGRFDGLHAYLDRQTFSDSGLIRERMRLKSDKKKKFRLTCMDGHNHFLFPIHVYDTSCDSISIEEVKLGNFTLRKDKGNHSFFPSRKHYVLASGDSLEVKGPIVRLQAGSMEMLHAYEHASQDGDVIQKVRKKPVTESGTDSQQGVTGELYPITDDDMWFIATEIRLTGNHQLTVCDKIRHGGYLNGEIIPNDRYYSTVWSVVAPVPSGASFEKELNEYIFDKISYNPASRKPDFYYNTWGMQRDYPSEQLYSIYTEENILAEIDRAAETGIERFVLDDGWEQAMGQWTANEERLGEEALKRISEAIKAKGMTPGIWISPLATTDTSEVFRKHQDWIIKDKTGEPVRGQWNCPVIDLGSPYYDQLLKQLYKLVDLGFKYFKWDGINTFNSTLDGFRGKGAKAPTDKEKIDRYNYQFPFYITDLMRDLRLYDPEVVVEIDLTENERALIGLMPLQEGKLYYINNGRSKYRDYSHANADSKREALEQVAGILPPETITLSVYPNNAKGSLRYNVHSVLAAGHGFWGRLDATSPEERAWIHNTLDLAKRILPHTSGQPLEFQRTTASPAHTGSGNDNIHILSQTDRNGGYAIITGFIDKRAESRDGATSGTQTSVAIGIEPEKVAGVVGCPFQQEDGGILVRFDLSADGSAAAFVFGSEGHGTRILKSDGILGDLHHEDGKLVVTALTDTEISVTDGNRGKSRTIKMKAGHTIKL